MTFLKRAIKSITRQFGKNIILLMLIFILGSIIAGALSVGRAVEATEQNLRRRMPALVSVGADEYAIIEVYRQTGEFPDTQLLSVDVFREIGELPYVRDFNYSLCAPLESFDLRYYVPRMRGAVESLLAFSYGGFPNWFDLYGASREELIHIEEGLIYIVAGRTLSVDEINTPNDSGITPTVVSSGFAEANQLQLGSVFTLYSMIPDRNSFDTGDSAQWQKENLFAIRDFQFEIVGLFNMVNREREAELDALNDADWDVFNLHQELLNQFYVPNHATEQIRRFRFDAINEMDGGIRTEADFLPPITSLYVLEDPIYIEDFAAAAKLLLPEFHGVNDLSNAFADISASMETLQEISGLILWIAIGATLLILSLLITLFLRDRRHEIGIYLALGEKRSKIISQILIEIVVVALVGIALSVVAGNLVSSEISQNMIRNELAELAEARNVQTDPYAPRTRISIFGSNSLAGMGFNFEMTSDEMLEQFDVSLNSSTTILILTIGLITVVVSTLIPVVYITKLSPKKVLM